MRLFIDTGSVAEVEEIAQWGILAGATTNPSLLAKEDGDPGEIVKRICDLVGGPTSAEVVSEDPAGMIAEGRALAELHEHVVVKVPFCKEGLEATHALTTDGIPVNMTLVFSPNQALLAAGAGATYVSCFMGRLDDISVDSGGVVAEIVECFRAGGVTAQIIAASIRHPEHVITSAQLGAWHEHAGVRHHAHMLAGDHFYLREQVDTVLALITHELSRSFAPASARRTEP